MANAEASTGTYRLYLLYWQKEYTIAQQKDISRALTALPVGISIPLAQLKSPEALAFKRGFQAGRFAFELKHSVRLPGFLPLRALLAHNI